MIYDTGEKNYNENSYLKQEWMSGATKKQFSRIWIAYVIFIQNCTSKRIQSHKLHKKYLQTFSYSILVKIQLFIENLIYLFCILPGLKTREECVGMQNIMNRRDGFAGHFGVILHNVCHFEVKAFIAGY